MESLPNCGINFKDVYHIILLNKNSGFHSHTFSRSVLYSELRGVERGRLLKCIDEHAPYRVVSAFDKATNGIREFLEYCEFPDEQLDDIESLLVNDVGVSSLEDLEFVGEDDLQNAGMYVKVNSPLYVNMCSYMAVVVVVNWCQELCHLCWGVSIHWTGLLDWTTGLDYWTHPKFCGMPFPALFNVGQKLKILIHSLKLIARPVVATFLE